MDVYAVRVVDVPVGTSADEAERLLNVPCAENRYMLVQVFLLPDGVTRAFYRLLAKAVHMTPNLRGLSNFDGKDEAARTIIRDNARLSVAVLVRKLADNGIKRGKNWVNDNRIALCGRKPGNYPRPRL